MRGGEKPAIGPGVKTPFEAGFRQPAEWDSHRAVWVAWPSAKDLWKEDLALAQEAFVGLCRAIVDLDAQGVRQGERLEVLVPTTSPSATPRRGLEGLGARFHRIPFGDIWLRDTAPIFVSQRHRARGGVVPLQRLGRQVRARARRPGLGRASPRRPAPAAFDCDFVLEGGSVEVDGEGTLLTTRQCLLNPNRNAATRRRSSSSCCATASARRRCSGSATGCSTTTPTATSTRSRASSRPASVVCMAPRGDGRPERAGARRRSSADLRGDARREGPRARGRHRAVARPRRLGTTAG